MLKYVTSFYISALLIGCASTSNTELPNTPKISQKSTNQFNYTGENSSELIYTTDAPNWVVHTKISDAKEDCAELKQSGDLFYDAQLRGGGFFGALQSINPLKPNENLKIVKKIPSGTTIQLQVNASTNGSYDASCGPISLKFQSGVQRKYKAHIGLTTKSCTLNVFDITTGQEVPVATSPLNCK